MKPRTRWNLLAGAITGLALFAACEDDEPMSGPQLTGDQATVQQIITGAARPILESVNLSDYTSLLVASLRTLAPLQCQPLEGCTSGSAEYCVEETGIRVNFANCSGSNTTVNGSIFFQGTATEGNAELALTLNGNEIAGNVAFSRSEECFTQSFTEVGVTLPNLSIVLNGYINYCSPTIREGIVIPTYAFLQFALPERVIRVEMFDSENPGSYQVTVLNQFETAILLVCDGSLFGSFSCFVP